MNHVISKFSGTSAKGPGCCITNKQDGAGKLKQKHIFLLFTVNVSAYGHAERCQQTENASPQKQGNMDGLTVEHDGTPLVLSALSYHQNYEFSISAYLSRSNYKISL